jgi:hypothetical protein
MKARLFKYNGKEAERVPSVLRLVANFIEGKDKITTPKEQALAWLLVQCVLYAESDEAGDALAEALNFLVQARDNQSGVMN